MEERKVKKLTKGVNSGKVLQKVASVRSVRKPLEKFFSAGMILTPREHWAMSGDVYCLVVTTGGCYQHLGGRG